MIGQSHFKNHVMPEAGVVRIEHLSFVKGNRPKRAGLYAVVLRGAHVEINYWHAGKHTACHNHEGKRIGWCSLSDEQVERIVAFAPYPDEADPETDELLSFRH